MGTASPSQKSQWKLNNKLINVIIENDGEIFGGAVRDKYLHDTHSFEFYNIINKLIEENVQKTIDINALYNDKSFHPELFGRWVVPNDIDALIHIDKYDNLIEKIKEKMGGEMKKLYSRDLKIYFPNIKIEENQVRHERFHITPIDKKKIVSLLIDIRKLVPYEMKDYLLNLNCFAKTIQTMKPIILDLIVLLKDVKYDPPFGNIDFECNSLIMDRDSIRLSSQFEKSQNPSMITDFLTKILNDILQKKAVFIYNNGYSWNRLCKMISKQWTIEGIFKDIEIVNEPFTGHCIICHEVFCNKMMKLKCCDSRYHPKCLLIAMESGTSSILSKSKCIMCQKNKSYTINRDYTILKEFIQIGEIFRHNWPIKIS